MDKFDQANLQHVPTHCTINRSIRLLGDIWTLTIVNTLMGGTRRFGELLEALGSVSPKTVSQRLKMLEEERIVERHAYAEIPPRVEYKLTSKGEALIGILKAMQEFEEQYLSENEQRDIQHVDEGRQATVE
jgi:DNA-binding HxlR family transcriptional regulator